MPDSISDQFRICFVRLDEVFVYFDHLDQIWASFDKKWVCFHRLNFKHFDQTLAWLKKFWHQSTLLAKLGCVVTISIKYGSILKPLIKYRFVSITLGYIPPAWTNFNYVGPSRLNLGTLWPSQQSIDGYTTGSNTIYPIPFYPLPNCPKPFKPCACCSDFRYESNGIFVLGVDFFSSDKFRLFN